MRRAAFTAAFTFGALGFLLGFLGAGPGAGTAAEAEGIAESLRWGALVPALVLGLTALGGFFERGFPDVGGAGLTAVFALCALVSCGGLVALFFSPTTSGGLAAFGGPGLVACALAAAVAWGAFAVAGWRARSRSSNPAPGAVRGD